MMTQTTNNEVLLQVNDLNVKLPIGRGQFVHAVKGIDFEIHNNERVGIVGESGSGKSVTVRAISGLLPQSKLVQVTGSIRYKGQEFIGASVKNLAHLQAKEISMIFQDPLSFLNPTMTVGKQITESLNQGNAKNRSRDEVYRFMTLAGLTKDLETVFDAYPFELSGGMRQRVLIAIALCREPEIVIADEPTTALDATVQRRVLHSLDQSVKSLGKSMLLITHDLGVVAAMCDRVYVMYSGKIVEHGTVDDIFYRPKHEYTKELLKSVESFSNNDEELYVSKYALRA
ncbi:MAG: ABC transporter ATP-binding protein [Microbacteriaceae bacterium]